MATVVSGRRYANGTVLQTFCSMKRLLQRHGWVKGWMGDEANGYCLMGAAHAIDGPCEFAVVDTMLATIPKGGMSIPDYNDAKVRTWADIDRFLGRCIAKAKRSAARRRRRRG